MKQKTINSLALLPLISTIFIPFYPVQSYAEPNFIFKSTTDPKLDAKFKDVAITDEEVSKNIQQELYKNEKNIYDLKINQLKSILLDRLIKNDHRSEGLGSEAFLQKYILNIKDPSDREITDFIMQRKVPQNQINQQLRDRIKTYLVAEQRKTAIDQWLEASTRDTPLEIYLTQPEPPKVDIQVSKEDQTSGGQDAKVTIIEFSEFQCPYCSRAAATTKEVLEKYGDKVRLVFKNFPLPMHENARKAAEYGLCANEQSSDKFWQLHDVMFANQNLLAEANLSDYAQKAGLDMDKLNSCITTGRFTDKIDLDMADANRAGVTSTPTFFINGTMLKGAQPASEFIAIIDKMLAK